MNKVKELRERAGLQQKELAIAIGVSQPSVSDWEHGRKDPSGDRLDKLAEYFGVDRAVIKGYEPIPGTIPPGFYAADGLSNVPVIGSIKAGPGGLAVQEVEGYELADVRNADEYLWLRVVGDSMEPEIHAGDLALIHRQECVESGELAAVIVNGEEGTLKKVIYSRNAIILQAFNLKYPPRVFSGRELDDVRIVGKVTETKRKW